MCGILIFGLPAEIIWSSPSTLCDRRDGCKDRIWRSSQIVVLVVPILAAACKHLIRSLVLYSGRSSRINAHKFFVGPYLPPNEFIPCNEHGKTTHEEDKPDAIELRL